MEPLLLYFIMSVFPKIIIKGKNKFVVLHMHVENNGNKNVEGKILFIIADPRNKKSKIEKKISIKGLGSVDKYYNFPIKKEILLGRYKVDGRFYFGKSYVRSETYKNDFFDVF